MHPFLSSVRNVGLVAISATLCACELTPTLTPPARSPDPPVLNRPTDGGRVGAQRGCPVPVQFTWRHGGLLTTGNTGVSVTHFLICVYRPGQACEWSEFGERRLADNRGSRVGLPGTPDHVWFVLATDSSLSRTRLGRTDITPVGVDPAYLYHFDAPPPANVPTPGGLPIPGLDPMLVGVPGLEWNVAACALSGSTPNCRLASPHALGVSTLATNTPGGLPGEEVPGELVPSVCEP